MVTNMIGSNPTISIITVNVSSINACLKEIVNVNKKMRPKYILSTKNTL